jgi:hypothetical protein
VGTVWGSEMAADVDHIAIDIDGKQGRSETSPCFPSAFLKGVGMSVWQNSGDGHDASANPQHASNWYNFAKSKKFFGQEKDHFEAWHVSNDFWNK